MSDRAAGQGSRADPAGGEVSQEEKQRRRRNRQLARKTPAQRRRLVQYQRRHNEKDGRIVYCDYCDLFISAQDKPLERHMSGRKHMDSVEAYWTMAEHAETLWMSEIRDKVQQAWTDAQAYRHRKSHATGVAVALPCVHVAEGVCVGGQMPSQTLPPAKDSAQGVLPTPPAHETPASQPTA